MSQQIDSAKSPKQSDSSRAQVTTNHDDLVEQRETVQSAQKGQVETKDIVTPYAFGVADDLLGQRLATPFQRGIAQLIDLTCVAVLSSLSALFLALIAAVTFFKASRNLAHKSQRGRTRTLLRIGGAIMLFWSTLLIMEVALDSGEPVKPDTTANNASAAAPILYGANWLAWSQCENDMDCLLNLAGEMGDAFGKEIVDEATFQKGLDDFVAKSELTDAQQSEIKAAYMEAFKNAEIEPIPEEGDKGTRSESAPQTTPLADATSPQTPPSTTYSVVEWVKGIIADLGLGFGWAALYYSVFTAWFHGKTPGKRLMNIRVLKLDGSELSLWDSFGRYGGYGAGLATGLLGFVQIYWDPNRQAIQDKISETLVISATR